MLKKTGAFDGTVHICHVYTFCQILLCCLSFIFGSILFSVYTHSAAFVNPLKPLSGEEEQLFNKGEVNKLIRRKQSDESLLKTAPTADEREIIHQIFVDSLNPK